MTDYINKKTLRVDLENFQSISKASLEFIQGINIIVGQSNSGKSAILRAIKGAIMNPSGSQRYIKNGEKDFKVGLEYEGNNVEWSRNSKSPTYTVNGEKYQKVGGSNLLDILDKSGFVLYDNKELMNIEGELELPFPFDKSNTELFKLFEKNIFCVSDSTAVSKLIKADEDEVTENKKMATYELGRAKEKLEALEELEKVIDIDKLMQGRNVLDKLFKDKEKLVLDISQLSGIIVLGKLLSKHIEPVNIVLNLHQDYINLMKDINKLDEIRGVGKVLQTKPTASTPQIFNISEYEELERAVKQVESAIQAISILSPLEAPTTKVIGEEYTSLRNDINTLLRIREQAQILQNDILQKKDEISKLEEKKKEFKVCPLCGRELNV